MIATFSTPYTERFMDTHRIVLLEDEGSSVLVGTTRALPEALRRTLQAHHGRAVESKLIDESDLRLRIQRHAALQIPDRKDHSRSSGRTGVVDIAETSTGAPAVNLANSLLSEAARLRASDLYLSPDGEEVAVKARIDGVIRRLAVCNVAHFRSLASRLKILAGLNGGERRRPQDGRFTAELDEDTFDVRLSTIPVSGGESLALRLFPQTRDALPLPELGLGDRETCVLSQAVSRASGLVLVSGPTGSGKTTTLHACIRSLGQSRRRIVTIEDPVEYRLPGVEQVQVNDSSGLTFEAALRRVLRHDPDAIMVGEIRDRETALLVVRAALTGHLVLSTLHADRALGIVRRLANLGADCSLLQVMSVVLIAQRLVRKVCTACRVSSPPLPEQVAWLESHGEAPPAALFHGRGCPACGNTGYLGRTAVSETFHGHGVDWMAAPAAGDALVQSGLWKIRHAVTTIEEVMWATGT